MEDITSHWPDFVIVVFTLFTAALMLLQSIGQLLIRPRSSANYLAAGLFTWVAVFLTNLSLGRDAIVAYLPHLDALHVPFYFLVGPVLRAYVLGIVGERNSTEAKRTTTSAEMEESDVPEWAPTARSPRFRFPGYPILIPFGLSVLAYLPFWFGSADFKHTVLLNPHKNGYYFAYYLLINAIVFSGMITAAVSIALTAYKLGLHEILGKKDSGPELWHLRFLLILIVALSIPGMYSQYIDSITWKRFTVSGVAFGILWVYLLDFRYPRFFRSIDRQVRSRKRAEKYNISRIGSLDVVAKLADLEKLMTEERIYADEDMNLERMATIAGLDRAQLSELLNTVLGTDFRSYITTFRVEEAKRMLIEESERGIMSIGFAVGFNSKASYFRNFRAYTSMTPSEYRASRGVSAVS